MIVTVVGKALMDYGITYEKAPKIWDAIVKTTLGLRLELILKNQLHRAFTPIAQSGYKNDNFWREIKETVIV